MRIKNKLWFFFFQAEDGIRAYKVTGVQTCALPISALTPERPVQETEALVTEPAVKSAPAPVATSAKSLPAPKRTESARPSPRDSRPVSVAARQEPAQTPPLTSSWPSSASTQPPAPAPTVDNSAQTTRPAENVPAEPVRAPEPPQKTFEELVVSSDSV